MVEDDTRSDKMTRRKDKRNNSGCAALFLIALPLLDVFGVLISNSGPYRSVLYLLGAVGFAWGVAVGAIVSVKIMKERWWSSCRWGIYGLLGMLFVPAVVIFFTFLARR